MRIQFEIKEGILLIDVAFENDHERTLKLVTAPLPFRVEDPDVVGSKGNFGKVNGQKKKIFCLPKHPSTGIPHLVGKTGVRIEEGTTEVGRIKTNEATLNQWWKNTLNTIRGGTNQQKAMSSEIENYTAQQSTVSLAAQGGGRSLTRILLD